MMGNIPGRFVSLDVFVSIVGGCQWPISIICITEGSTEWSLSGLTRPRFGRLVSEREEDEFQSF